MKKIVVVDDEEYVRELVVATLEGNHGYEVLAVGDGLETLEIIRRERPELVCLNIVMPWMNGYDVCRALRADPSTAHTRVIMVTALAPVEDHWRAREAGADDYFTKPFSPLALLNKVKEMLEED